VLTVKMGTLLGGGGFRASIFQLNATSRLHEYYHKGHNVVMLA